MKENNKVYIVLKSYGIKELDDAVQGLINLTKSHKVKTCGPIPLPRKNPLFTVIRGPHIDKKSMEQFHQVEHKCLVCVQPTSSFIENFSTMNLPNGVDVKIKMVSSGAKNSKKL